MEEGYGHCEMYLCSHNYFVFFVWTGKLKHTDFFAVVLTLFCNTQYR